MKNLLSALFGIGITELDATAVQAKLKEKPAPLLIDVREQHEFSNGHITHARHIPLGALTQRLRELPHDREIICVCHSGNRSRAAVSQLVAAGFKAINLRGGMLGWAQAGLPIQKGAR